MGAAPSQPVPRAFEDEKQALAQRMGDLSLRDAKGKYAYEEEYQRASNSNSNVLLDRIANVHIYCSPSLLCPRESDDHLSVPG